MSKSGLRLAVPNQRKIQPKPSQAGVSAGESGAAKRMRRLSNPGGTPTKLGSLPWLDTSPTTRRWLAKWLCTSWERLFFSSLSNIHGRQVPLVCETMEAGMRWLSKRLPALTSAEQLAALDALARTSGLETTRQHLLSELESDLRAVPRRNRGGSNKEQIRRASPWRSVVAIERLTDEQLGFPILRKHYREPPDLAQAFDSVVVDLSVSDAWSEWPPAQTTTSPQRNLSAAIRFLCGRESHPGRLAAFVLRVVRECRSVPQAQQSLLKKYFDARRRHQILQSHLRSSHTRKTRRSVALDALFRAIVQHADLRADLIQLSEAGEQPLASALTDLFQHIRSEVHLPQQARVDDIVVLRDNELRSLRIKEQQHRLEQRLATLPRSRRLRSKRPAEYDGKDSLYTQILKARRKFGLTERRRA
jgi:hypothetical protein